jgi:hypothetical protein
MFNLSLELIKCPLQTFKNIWLNWLLNKMFIIKVEWLKNFNYSICGFCCSGCRLLLLQGSWPPTLGFTLSIFMLSPFNIMFQSLEERFLTNNIKCNQELLCLFMNIMSNILLIRITLYVSRAANPFRLLYGLIDVC